MIIILKQPSLPLFYTQIYPNHFPLSYKEEELLRNWKKKKNSKKKVIIVGQFLIVWRLQHCNPHPKPNTLSEKTHQEKLQCHASIYIQNKIKIKIKIKTNSLELESIFFFNSLNVVLFMIKLTWYCGGMNRIRGSSQRKMRKTFSTFWL